MGEGSEWNEASSDDYFDSCETHSKNLSCRQKENRCCRTPTLGKVQGGKEEGGVELWTRGENDSSNRRDSSGKFLRSECRKLFGYRAS
jgi:hypothetical protein